MASTDYDVIVIGGGHAGCEAASAAARMGARTALFTINRDMIAQMSCNPSVGGIAKGHLVREIDAVGGVMGEVADRTGIQFRLLNRSRGPAVQAPRAQADKELYRREMQRLLSEQENLDILGEEVCALRREGGRVVGVETGGSVLRRARAVVLTTGTFLNGLCHVGEQKFRAGRSGEKSSIELAASLAEIGFSMGRLKTGTPPRLRRGSLDLSRFESQPGDPEPTFFSFRSSRLCQPQVECWIAYTNERVHEIIRANLHRSPLYGGEIVGIGPRYCPSIEDKVVKFEERPQHQLFLEPESLSTDIIYVNGLSTSLPLDVQRSLVAAIEGLGRAEMIRPGYAVEYDFVQPTQLYPWLEAKQAEGLFHAGQINGTTGYEEAAAQGLVAGINAALKAAGSSPFIFERSRSYLGILMDDLVTRGVDEPYRMFTSRAEYRLLLRIDNADRRLMPVGHALGLVPTALYGQFREKWRRVDRAIEWLGEAAGRRQGEELRRELGAEPGVPLLQLLKRPECRIEQLLPALRAAGLELSREEAQSVEIQVKYQGYIDQQLRDVARLQSLEDRVIPADLDYGALEGLSHEMVERLTQVRPRSLGQASRIPGVTPAAVSAINIHLELKRRARLS